MKKYKYAILIAVIVAAFLYSYMKPAQTNTMNMADKVEKLVKEKEAPMSTTNEKKLKEIYLAGGCFWGLEDYFANIDGVEDVSVGYANGTRDTTSYEKLKQTGHAETVHVIYDESKVDLRSIILYYFRVVDPTSVNQQGNDRGSQYRSGIYYQTKEELSIIEQVMSDEAEKLEKPLAIEVAPIMNYVVAEEYHQDYLKKNPGGYCHIDVEQAKIPLIDMHKYPKPSDEELHEKLSETQYNVTQKGTTEGAFSNQYWDTFEDGVYVDIATGEPLFSSKDKFESGCGWPSFSKPISSEVVTYMEDTSFNMKRVEARSRSGDSHLGHVFEDGPKSSGGLRFCINSASITFIAKADMEEHGYGYLLNLV